MNRLDEIAARADVIDRCLRDNPNDCYDRGDLDEAVIAAREDVPKLVAALRNVENLAKHWETCAPGDRYYARMVRAAIKDALGS